MDRMTPTPAPARWQENRGPDGGAAVARAGGGRAEARLPSGEKVGRNDPCPCGSGKKYKKCCLLKSA
jgi:hypothetical protein